MNLLCRDKNCIEWHKRQEENEICLGRSVELLFYRYGNDESITAICECGWSGEFDSLEELISGKTI